MKLFIFLFLSSLSITFCSAKPTHHHSKLNTCLQYFEDTAGKSNIRFKSVTVSEYSSTDSLLRNKELETKITTLYGKMGEPHLVLTYNNAGLLTDSTQYDYDTAFHRVREIRYKDYWGDSTMHGIYDSRRTYNEYGALVKDSTWEPNEDSPHYGYYYTTIHIYKFDSARRETEEMKIKYGDTSIIIYTRDNKGRTIAEKYLTGGKPDGLRTYEYDSAGMLINEQDISEDTTGWKRHYDSKHRLTEEDRYRNGELNSSMNYMFTADSGRIVISTTYPSKRGTNPFSCNYNYQTTTNYDKHSNIISEVTYSHEGENTDTVTKINKHIVENGKIVGDSSIEISKSNKSYSKTIKVGYARSGTSSQSGSTHNGEWADKSYNNQHKLLVELFYNSCSSIPYKVVANAYYPDGVTLKQHIENNKQYSEVSTRQYGKDSRILEEKRVTPRKTELKVYEYKE